MKKFDQYSRHLQVLCRAEQQDITNEFIVSGIIYKFYIQFEFGWKVLFVTLEQHIRERNENEVLEKL